MASGFGGFGGVGPFGQKLADGEGVQFHPIDPAEQQNILHGIDPKHKNFTCGHCGKLTNGRVVCTFLRKENKGIISWCHCSCERQEPTVIVENFVNGEFAQFPEAREFHPGESWPDDLSQLYEEAARSFAGTAYTAATMVCRKILMVCACLEKAEDGKPFTEYVKYLTDNVLTFPKAKGSIDKIRTIGNDANHSVDFVSRDDAKKAMQIITYLLNTIYSLPSDKFSSP